MKSGDAVGEVVGVVTTPGWLVIATWELSISTVVAPARSAITRSASVGMIRS
jgi:hypothetical protein